MTWSGVCLRAIVSVIPPVSIVGHEYSHSHWTTFRGPNHFDENKWNETGRQLALEVQREVGEGILVIYGV